MENKTNKWLQNLTHEDFIYVCVYFFIHCDFMVIDNRISKDGKMTIEKILNKEAISRGINGDVYSIALNNILHELKTKGKTEEVFHDIPNGLELTD